MIQSAGNENWTIDVPSGWRQKKGDESVSLLPPAEIGALQLSGHQRDDAHVTDEDLLEFAADHLDAGAPRRDVRLGDFMGFEIAYDAEGFACREWYLRRGRQPSETTHHDISQKYKAAFKNLSMELKKKIDNEYSRGLNESIDNKYLLSSAGTEMVRKVQPNVEEYYSLNN